MVAKEKINISTLNKTKLNNIKEHGRETYDDILTRVLKENHELNNR